MSSTSYLRTAKFPTLDDGSGSRLPTPLRRIATLIFLAIVCGLSSPTLPAASNDHDPVLREKLQAALLEPLYFEDQFEAEVWLTDMATRLADRVPDPEERLEILTAVHREAARVDLPPEMILAVIDVESGFEPYAVSSANAQGLMQVMRFWLTELNMPGTALLDIRENVRMGCTILRHYYDLENGNWTRALARYNGSVGRREYADKVFTSQRTRWFQQ
ncbi:MAG: lytic transglycosylase domain-containing protein [Gammaproteobacteria bacterium]